MKNISYWRSHKFAIRSRSSSIDERKKLLNLNVRGKRGNIVQVYPSVEYDFVPNKLELSKNDHVHIQYNILRAKKPNYFIYILFNLLSSQDGLAQILIRIITMVKAKRAQIARTLFYWELEWVFKCLKFYEISNWVYYMG